MRHQIGQSIGRPRRVDCHHNARRIGHYGIDWLPLPRPVFKPANHLFYVVAQLGDDQTSTRGSVATGPPAIHNESRSQRISGNLGGHIGLGNVDCSTRVPLLPSIKAASVDEYESRIPRLNRSLNITWVGLEGKAPRKVGRAVGGSSFGVHEATLRRHDAASPPRSGSNGERIAQEMRAWAHLREVWSTKTCQCPAPRLTRGIGSAFKTPRKSPLPRHSLLTHPVMTRRL